MKTFLLLTIFLLSTFAYATPTPEQRTADCKSIREYAAKGDKLYQERQFSKAREQYESQVAWSESCGLPDSNIATAYNNVALTYIHEGDFLKASAWLSIASNDKKSIYNLSKIQDKLEEARKSTSGNPAGEYWNYAGKSSWSVFTVKQVENEKYSVEFQGYYAGPMAMYGGINMGEFGTTLSIKDGRATVDLSKNEAHLDCVFEFKFLDAKLTVNLLSGDNCGFGMNVRADGTYEKVSR